MQRREPCADTATRTSSQGLHLPPTAVGRWGCVTPRWGPHAGQGRGRVQSGAACQEPGAPLGCPPSWHVEAPISTSVLCISGTPGWEWRCRRGTPATETQQEAGQETADHLGLKEPAHESSKEGDGENRERAPGEVRKVNSRQGQGYKCSALPRCRVRRLGQGCRVFGGMAAGSADHGSPMTVTEDRSTPHTFCPMHFLPGGPVGLSLRAFKCFHAHTHTQGKRTEILKERDKKKKMKKK